MFHFDVFKDALRLFPKRVKTLSYILWTCSNIPIYGIFFIFFVPNEIIIKFMCHGFDTNDSTTHLMKNPSSLVIVVSSLRWKVSFWPSFISLFVLFVCPENLEKRRLRNLPARPPSGFSLMLSYCSPMLYGETNGFSHLVFTLFFMIAIWSAAVFGSMEIWALGIGMGKPSHCFIDFIFFFMHLRIRNLDIR